MAFASVNGTQLFYTSFGKGLRCLVMHDGLGLDHTYLCPHLDALGDALQTTTTAAMVVQGGLRGRR